MSGDKGHNVNVCVYCIETVANYYAKSIIMFSLCRYARLGITLNVMSPMDNVSHSSSWKGSDGVSLLLFSTRLGLNLKVSDSKESYVYSVRKEVEYGGGT